MLSTVSSRDYIQHAAGSVAAVTLSVAIATTIAFAQPPQKVILLVGAPGSGKTTQAKLLSKKYGLPSISMSDLLKKEMATRKDAVSKALAPSIASGEVLPDEAAANLIRTRLLKGDHKRGFILDGFPATAGQAKALDRILQEEQLPKAVVVVLDAPDEVIRKRMLARRRADDTPEIIDRRVREFRNEAALLVGWVGATRIVRVNADASIANVSTQIVAGLEDAWSKHEFKARQ